MKTQMSRFPIHDDLTAPRARCRSSRARRPAGQLPNFLGVLAGSPAALRGLRALPRRAAPRHVCRCRRSSGSRSRSPSTTASQPGLAIHTRTAAPGRPRHRRGRRAPRDWDSRDPREAALLRYLRALARATAAHAPMHLHEEAREAGWSDEQLLEAIAVVALESFTAMVNVAGEVPVDGSVEETRVLRAA